MRLTTLLFDPRRCAPHPQGGKGPLSCPQGNQSDTDDEVLTLMWNQRRHRGTIPYHPLTNTSSFRTARASRTYRAFVAIFEAAEAQYHRREHILQMPSQLHLEKEFTAEENVHTGILKKPLMAS